MKSSKKIALIFLAVVNLMNIAAGIITELKIALNKDVTSIIPIRADLTVNQILLVNFMAVVLIIFLISVVTAYLTTDIPYSPVEIIKNCPSMFIIAPAIVFFIAVFNTVVTEITADKICIIISAIIYFLFCVFNFGAIATIREDAEE